MEQKKGFKLGLNQKQGLIGWAFLSVAAALIIVMNFYPMFRGFLFSLQTGVGANMEYAGLFNYRRLLEDPQFRQTVSNTFFYLAVQVPVMIVLGLILASMLNSKNLKFKGFFRTTIFLPCTVGLVAYSLVFRQMFAVSGIVNTIAMNIGIMDTPFNWFGTAWSARLIIILGLLWRWTGFNMIFYLAGLQNIDQSIYEAARIDGANVLQQFRRITIPVLRPIILLTAIMSTNGTLQLFDESVNLTGGGPGITSRSMSHHIFNAAFQGIPQIGYASAMSFVILLFVGTLAFIQIKIGDKR
ncbi:MAG: sugar ABC transporter permease [Defluviitaleaceae bacterium]|nr:sugar ABC transporter permease [Defluviitaleaceae bacterium]MCL2240743.1 sugar ABC transporter permease [Defluviitaleaceae bacterium]